MCVYQYLKQIHLDVKKENHIRKRKRIEKESHIRK